jgi:GntR family transcriptional regulator
MAPAYAAALQVDKTRATPAYLQLRAALRREVLAGTFAPGEALPSERELAAALGLSRMTVRRALETLIADGLAERRRGSGTYVLPRRLEQTFDRVLGFVEEARALGFRAGSTLLGAAVVPADPQVAAALRLVPDTPVLRLSRLRTADGTPLAVQVSHLPPHLATVSLERLQAFGSLYRTLAEDFGVVPQGARQVVGARMPTRDERQHLGLPKGVPVLTLERTTFGAERAPFEFVRSVYRSDRYQLALEL